MFVILQEIPEFDIPFSGREKKYHEQLRYYHPYDLFFPGEIMHSEKHWANENIQNTLFIKNTSE